MLKQVIKDGAIYLASEILSKGIALLLVPLYTRFLAPKDYGILDMLLIFGALIRIVMPLEISRGAGRFYAEYRSSTDRLQYTSTGLQFTLFAYFVFALGACYWAESLAATIIGEPGHTFLFQVAVVSYVLIGLFVYLKNRLRWELKPKAFGISNLLDVCLTVSTSIVLVAFLDYGLVGVFLGQICGALGGLISAFLFGRHLYKERCSLAKLKDMLRFSCPLVFSSLGIFLATFIDRIALKELSSLDDVGIYGIAFRFAFLVTLISFGFQYPLQPVFLSRYEHPDTPNELARLFRYFVLVMCSLILALGLFAKEILYILTTPAYYGAFSLIPILGVASFLSHAHIFAPGPILMKQTSRVAGISISAALINCILNLYLIPLWGVHGAALATTTGFFIAFVMHMILSQTLYYAPHLWSRIIFTAILLGIVISTIHQTSLALTLGQVLVMKIMLFLLLVPIICLILFPLPELRHLSNRLLATIRSST